MNVHGAGTSERVWDGLGQDVIPHLELPGFLDVFCHPQLPLSRPGLTSYSQGPALARKRRRPALWMWSIVCAAVYARKGMPSAAGSIAQPMVGPSSMSGAAVRIVDYPPGQRP